MLDIITICDRGDNANTYVVGNTDKVIIIDPANRLSNITTAVKNRKVLGVFLTHAHYDHFITLTDVLNKYNVNCYMHQKGFEKGVQREKRFPKCFSLSAVHAITGRPRAEAGGVHFRVQTRIRLRCSLC